jgi:hypothetical protein
MSSRLKFVETLISPVSSFSSASSSSLAPSPPTSPTRPLFTTEFFEVRPSAKGGYGAFAIENIAKGTIILTEKALFTAEFTEVFYAYENLKPKERKEYRSLYSYQGVDNELLLAIFKTNR